MAGITWLHLSDWHQQGKNFDRQVVRDALIEDILNRASINPDLAKIDFPRRGDAEGRCSHVIAPRNRVTLTGAGAVAYDE
jgi:hypothetical protein